MKSKLSQERDSQSQQNWNSFKFCQLEAKKLLQENVLKPSSSLSKRNNLIEHAAFHEVQDNSLAKLTKKRRKNVWNQAETSNLIRLHDQLGNKWSTISKRFPGKTQNDVKNRFFSLLRRGLRHLNKASQKLKMEKNWQIKSSVLYEIIGSCGDQLKSQSNLTSDLRELAKQLKSGIFDFQTKNEIYKYSQVFQLIQKVKAFISLKHPYVRPRKRKAQQTQAIVAFDESFSEEYEPSPELAALKQVSCKIKQMKTIGESENELVVKETASQQQQKKVEDKLIEKPPICLNDPFEQLKILITFEDEKSYIIDQDFENQSYLAFCYPEFKCPGQDSLL